MESRLVESRLCRCAYRRQHQYQNSISRNSMVLVYLLRVVDASIEGGDEVLCESNKGLDNEKDVRRESEDGMR